MPAMTDYLSNKLIDHVLRGIVYTPPSALYIGLYTAAPTKAGGGTEVTGGGYARQSLPPSATNWAATNGAGSVTNPSSGTSDTSSNNVAITFPNSTANWGTVMAFAIFDGPTGNMLLIGTVPSKDIPSGDIASFANGTLVVSMN